MSTRHDGVVDACQHKELEYLGENGDARFLRCEGCRMVFVLQGGEAWGIPAVNAAARRPERR
jgi:hypothetical protein